MTLVFSLRKAIYYSLRQLEDSVRHRDWAENENKSRTLFFPMLHLHILTYVYVYHEFKYRSPINAGCFNIGDITIVTFPV